MQNKMPVLERFLALAGAIIAWAAVIIQLYLMLENRTTSISESLVRFFSFFTILTNILVAISLTAVAAKRIGQNAFFTRPTVLSAITVYILVVGIVYNLVLRSLWQPQGLQMLVDEFLHSVNPVYYLFFWLVRVPKQSLKWSSVFPWLIYPLLYLVCILLRGAASQFYPYPFVNVTNLGYEKVAVNALVLLIAFSALSLLMIALAKLMNRKIKTV